MKKLIISLFRSLPLLNIFVNSYSPLPNQERRFFIHFQTSDEGSGLFVSLTTHLLLSSSSHERSTSVFWG